MTQRTAPSSRRAPWKGNSTFNQSNDIDLAIKLITRMPRMRQATALFLQPHAQPVVAELCTEEPHSRNLLSRIIACSEDQGMHSCNVSNLAAGLAIRAWKALRTTRLLMLKH